MANLVNQIGNQFMQVILRSPLHGWLSGSTALVTVTGRKSGQAFTTPVNYVRQGNVVYITSRRERTWWRNLRGGGPVTLHLQGQEVKGSATVAEDDPGVAAGLTAYLSQAPQHAKYFGVALDSNGQPRADDVAHTAPTRVVIQVKLD